MFPHTQTFSISLMPRLVKLKLVIRTFHFRRNFQTFCQAEKLMKNIVPRKRRDSIEGEIEKSVGEVVGNFSELES